MTFTDFYANALFNGFIEGCVIALMALALTLVFAVARFPNAAVGDMMTFAAYLAKAAGLGAGLMLIPATLLAGVATAAVAIFFHLWVFRPLARYSHMAALIASIGVGMLLRNLVALAVGSDPLTYDLPLVRATHVLGLLVQATDLWVIGATAATAASIFALLYLTPLGRRLRAIADDPDLARSSGIRSGRALIFLWSMVGVVCAIAGILLGVKSVLQPEMGWNLLLPGFTAAVIGGIGNPIGAVLGGLVIGLAQEIGAFFVGHSYKIAVSFVILSGLLLWRREGLLGRSEGVR